MALNTYGHVFDELEGTKPASAEELIRKARVSQVRPQPRAVSSTENKNPADRGVLESRRADSNRGPLHYE